MARHPGGMSSGGSDGGRVSHTVRRRLGWAAEKLVTPVLTGAVLVVFGVIATPLVAQRLESPSCSDPRDLVPAVPKTAEGSSKPDDDFPTKGRVTYGPENLYDGSTSTAWVEGSPGLGRGTAVTLRFDRDVDVRLVCVVDGYAESWDLYKRNSRVRLLNVETAQGTRSALLADAGSPDRPAVYQDVNVVRGDSTYVSFTVKSAYAAQRDTTATQAYPDTSVSEVEVWAAG
jgi:hypothetical protein